MMGTINMTMPHGHPGPLRWLIGIELARYRNMASASAWPEPGDSPTRSGR